MRAIDFAPMQALAAKADELWQRYLTHAINQLQQAMILQADAKELFSYEYEILELQMRPEPVKTWTAIVRHLQRRLESFLQAEGCPISPDYGMCFELKVTHFRDSPHRELNHFHLSQLKEARAAEGFAARLENLVAQFTPGRLQALHDQELAAGIAAPLTNRRNGVFVTPTPVKGGVLVDIAIYRGFDDWTLSEGSAQGLTNFFNRLAQLNERQGNQLSLDQFAADRAQRWLWQAVRGYVSRAKLELGSDAGITLFKDKATLFLSTSTFEAIQIFLAGDGVSDRRAA